MPPRRFKVTDEDGLANVRMVEGERLKCKDCGEKFWAWKGVGAEYCAKCLVKDPNRLRRQERGGWKYKYEKVAKQEPLPGLDE